MATVVTVERDTPGSRIDSILRRDGCVIVRDAIDCTRIDSPLGDLESRMARKDCGNDGFVGYRTRRPHPPSGGRLSRRSGDRQRDRAAA